LSKRFIGVDRSGDLNHPTDNLYYVATRFTRRKKETKWVVCVSYEQKKTFQKSVPEWHESIAAIMMFKAVNKIFHPGYSIQIDKDFQGQSREKVLYYMQRLFGSVNYGKPFWADPPIEFLPKEYSSSVKHADGKSKLARKKELPSDEVDPNVEDLLCILKKARRTKNR
jgi:hypothetical protein